MSNTIHEYYAIYHKEVLETEYQIPTLGSNRFLNLNGMRQSSQDFGMGRRLIIFYV